MTSIFVILANLATIGTPAAAYNGGEYSYGTYEPPEPWMLGLVAAGMVIILFILLAVILTRITRAGPHEALVISGRQRRVRDPSGRIRTINFYIKKAGATFVWPFIERVDRLSLELVSFDVGTAGSYSIKGVPIPIKGGVQFKVGGSESSIAAAAEQFMTGGIEAIRRVGSQVIEGHIRAMLSTMTVDGLSNNRQAFLQKLRDAISADFANMGLEIIGFNIYIEDMPPEDDGMPAEDVELRQL
jgi:flotillin